MNAEGTMEYRTAVRRMHYPFQNKDEMITITYGACDLEKTENSMAAQNKKSISETLSEEKTNTSERNIQNNNDTKDKFYICPDCGKLHSYESLSHNKVYKLSGSLNVVEMDRRHVCKYCDMRFFAKRHLEQHLSTHAKDMPYSCNECEKVFRTEIGAVTHIKIHKGILTFKCDLCRKRFLNKFDLITHHLKSHSVYTCVCHICGKDFHSKYHLKCQMFVHTGRQQYLCDVCGMKLSNIGILKRHMATHI